MKSFKAMMAEVAEPNSEEEKAFKAQHKVASNKHPVATEFQHKGVAKSKAKRLSDQEGSANYDLAYEATDYMLENPQEEIPMMMSQLAFLCYAAEEISGMLKLGGDPEEWFQNKLAGVSSDMQSMYAYMQGKNQMGEAVYTTKKEELSAKQKKIDLNKNGKVDGNDLAMLRAKKMKEEAEQIDELSKKTLKSYKKAATSQVMTAFNRDPSDYYTQKMADKMDRRAGNIGTAAAKLDKIKKMKNKLKEEVQYVAEGSKANKTHLAMAYLKAVVMAPMKTPEKRKILNWQQILSNKFDIEMDTAALARMLPQFDSDLKSGKFNRLQDKMAYDGELTIENVEEGYASAAQRKAVWASRNEKGVKEELKGNQHKIDKNKNGKIDAQDFKLLNKESVLAEISTKLLAKAAQSASDPMKQYDDDEKYHDPQKFADHAKKTKDAKSAAAVQGAADGKGHYPRPGQAKGYDSLASRTPPRVTATGKANKQDVKTLKKNIKNEEVELDEADKPVSPFDLKNYKSQIPTKAGEKAGFDSKKVSTGTVYSRKPVKEAAYEKDMDEKKKVIVKGVKGMKSTPFTKTFRNMAAYDKWSDSDAASDYEVKQVMNESAEETLDEAFKTGLVKLKDGSSMVLKKEDADILNKLLGKMSDGSVKKMTETAMKDKNGFAEILAFAKEAA